MNSPIISIRVSPEDRQTLQQLAEEDHRTVSNYTHKIVSEYLRSLQRSVEAPKRKLPVASR